MKPYVLSYADLVAVYGPERAFRVLITVETVANKQPNISRTNQEERLHDALAALGCLADDAEEEEGEEILPEAASSGEEGSCVKHWSAAALAALEAVASA